MVFFHYLSAIFTNAGSIPEVLPLELAPTVTMCYRCTVPRPPRAHHCNVCGACVLRMDHHCPWIANCVGLHTHRHFYLSLFFMSVGGLYMITVGRGDFVKHSTELQQPLDLSSVDPRPWTHSDRSATMTVLHKLSSVYFQLALVAVPLVMGLCIWQSYLITRGETNVEYHINERFRQRLRRRGLLYRNPYDFGPKANWLHFLALYNPGEFPRILVPSRGTLVRRFLMRVLLPSRTVLCENGLNYKLNIPTVQSVIESLSESNNEEV
ncbi:hypothetical protein CRM22_008156 [Opisthorchis felineus]|uniref:Palmitoyltransferase n=2 Tax=Opisthorchis felineus TaxID=147828 RepID=A0A4V3SDL8_OPIFE|nr:hypothetical protein CRM22_008156 [Opisthorchis felineus]